MNHYFETCPGWFDYPEIFNLAISQAVDGDTLVETGTWFGASACYMGVEIINSGKKLKFITIDNDTKYEEYADFPGALISRSEKILENIKPLKCVKYINGDSLLEAGKFKDGSLRMVFLDALHEYWFVAKELEAWFSKVMPGGIFAGHDFCFTGVKQAVDEFTQRHNLTYKMIGSSWLITI